MSIFNMVSVTEANLSVEASTDYIEPTLEGVQGLILEAAEQSFALEASLYVADIMASQQVLEGASVESVLEGFAGTAMSRLKAMWQKLWSKVQGWFKSVINRVNLVFQSGSKLVDTFGAELKNKSAAGFKYTAPKYNVAAGEKEADKLIGALEVEFKDNFKIADDITKGNGGDVVANSFAKAGNSEKTAEDILKAAASKVEGAQTLTEANEAIVKAYRGGDSVEIENFAHVSVGTMLDFVKSGKNEVAKLSRAKSETDDKFKKVIATIEHAAKEFIKNESVHGSDDSNNQKKNRNERSAKMTTYFSKVISILQQVVSGILAVQGVKIKMYEEVVRSYQSTIKKFAAFKGPKAVKESSTDEEDDVEDDEDGSVLEAAMRLF